MKLGLIAMSGVRVHNQRLADLGLTLPGFVQRSEVIASLPSLALLTLAALTPEEVELRYLEVDELDDLGTDAEAFDCVAISSYSARIKDAYALADRFRNRGKKVILGGLHVSAMPEEAARHADCIVLGEGELAWRAVIRDLQRGRLQKVYDRRGESFDLADAPVPRFDLLDIGRYNRLTVQTQRGCPLDCEFCAASLRLSPKFKTKPVDKVIAEVRAIKALWARPFIELADDNTFANKAHGKRLARALAEEDVRWFTETDLSVADDDALLSLLRDSGCAQILVGLESPSRQALEGLETKSNWKADRAPRYLEAIEKIQSYGVTVNGCFILGLDGTDRDSFQEVLDFIEKSALYEVQITVQTPFPGTPLYERLKSQNRLIKPEAWETCTLFDVNFVPQHMTVVELEARFEWLMGEIYSEAATGRRRGAFRRTARRA